MKSLSCVQLFATPWTVDYQVPLAMGFSRQEQWSGLPFPSPGDLPDLGIKAGFPSLQADALTSEPPGVEGMGKGFYKEWIISGKVTFLWGKERGWGGVGYIL